MVKIKVILMESNISIDDMHMRLRVRSAIKNCKLTYPGWNQCPPWERKTFCLANRHRQIFLLSSDLLENKDQRHVNWENHQRDERTCVIMIIIMMSFINV